MDEVADAVGKDVKKPPFYYADVSQQKKFNCTACDCFNDIFGRYGYCSNCGTHNGLDEVTADATRIRDTIKTTNQYEACVKDVVGAFDSFARQMSKQLAARIPMMPDRKKEWEQKLFHQLSSCADSLKAVFGIDLFKGIKPEDIEFAKMMFHRRHIYEHNGGEVDEKYIRDSGDKSVQLKQALRETVETAHRIINVVLRFSSNLHTGFHSIFPPQERPIRIHQDYKNRMAERFHPS